MKQRSQVALFLSIAVVLIVWSCTTQIGPSVAAERRFTGTVTNASGASVPFDMSLFLRKLASGHQGITGGFTAGDVVGTVSGTLDGTLELGTFNGSLSVDTVAASPVTPTLLSAAVETPPDSPPSTLHLGDGVAHCVFEQEYSGTLSGTNLNWTPGAILHNCAVNPLGFTIQLAPSVQPPTTSVPTTSSSPTTSVPTTTSTSSTSTVASTTSTSVRPTTRPSTTTTIPSTTILSSTTTTMEPTVSTTTSSTVSTTTSSSTSTSTITTTSTSTSTSTTTSITTTSTSTTTSLPTTTTTTIPITNCGFSLNPSSAQFPPSGGKGTFDVTVVPGCSWRVTSAQGATVLSPAIGVIVQGNGTVTYTVPAEFGKASIFLANAIEPDNVATFVIVETIEGLAAPK